MSNPMNLDQALAVYEFLKHRGPGNMDQDEDRAFKHAWAVICEHAVQVIKDRA